MSVRLDKPWRELTAAAVEALPGQLGVYQIGDDDGRILYIGFAGGRSLFGLRGELEGQLAARPDGAKFRYEVNQQYTTRYRELLMVHVADHGRLPADNADNPPPNLGRLSPG